MAVVRAGGVDRVGSRCLGQVGDLLTQKLAVTGEGLYVTSRPCREGAWSSSSIARVSWRRSGVIMNKAIGHDFPLSILLSVTGTRLGAKAHLIAVLRRTGVAATQPAPTISPAAIFP